MARGVGLKIAHICYYYYPYRVTGASATARGLAKAQLARGHSPTVYTTLWPGTVAEEVQDGIPVRRLRRRLTRWFRNFVPSLLPALYRDRPDVVHAQAVWGHVPIALLASRLRGAAFVLHPQGTWQWWFKLPPAEKSRGEFWYLHTLWRLLVRAADACLALNGDEVQFLHACGARVGRVHLIPNGVDPQTFRLTSGDYFARLGVDGPVALFVGAVEAKKGIYTIAEAMPAVMQRFPRTTFVFVGGSELERLKETLAAMGLGQRALLLGPKHGRELVDIYSSADVVLAPSQYEPLGIVLLEAMACERTVISTNAGGPKEIISDGEDGFLIPPGDSDALAQRINALLADEDMRREMGRRARQKVLAKYDWAFIGEKVMRVYEECLR